MKNLYRRICKANQPLEQTEENPSDKKLLNELCATNLRIRALQKKQSSAEAGARARRAQYFPELEKRNHYRKTVTKFKINNNDYTSNQFPILSGKSSTKPKSLKPPSSLIQPFLRLKTLIFFSKRRRKIIM